MDGDSDFAWTQFLISKGHIEKEAFLTRSTHFYHQYSKGTLNIAEYVAFVAEPMQRLWPEKLIVLQDEYIQHISAMMLPAAFDLIARHRERGDYTMIMTATPNVIAGGICNAFGVDGWKATMLEVGSSGITGKIDGTPCFQQGKSTILRSWIDQRPQFSFERAWFYSDSRNDLPLLNEVAMPVAVDPDTALRTHAQEHRWPIVSLRTTNLEEIPYAP